MTVPLIIDTDPGVDDLLAILLALASPEVTLEAVTLTFGNTTLDYAFDNMMRLAHALQVTADAGALKNDTLLERVKNGNSGTPIPVALGATKPLGGRLFTAGYFHGRDGMSGVSFLEGDPFPKANESKLFAQSKLPSDELILDVLRRHPPNTVRIAAVAPLTNLAQAFLKDPETFRRVGVISVMGGALDVPGNTSPTAEFNFFADPWAAKVLLEDAVKDGQPPLPIYLFPLDITSKHTVPYGALVREEGDALYDESYLARLISLFLRKPRSVTNSFAPPEVTFDASVHDLFEAHDPLAVAHAIFCESAEGWKVSARPFLVESEGKLTRGFCVVDRRNHGASVQGRNKAEIEEAHGPANEHGLEPAKKKRAMEKDEAPALLGVPLINIVTETPGIPWFSDMFLERLGMLA
ncbi:uncharacterized protein MJAP1_000935 [Malassezia japonica]|uniref:Inosine/uridine-preferring nucleoside hydrolase domain-containing protein n=1 Tax=Malassezia japonica TaxID=223818 RepID=A0AAF0F425_9BASI|nr:uncharacterized protein MJAP1_000935 [Malassezia japonica]WFD37987.1 hypothetical protein MJAP1_000935 [Malassezia japonica]